MKPPTGLKCLEIGFTLRSILRLWIDWKQIVWVVPELMDDWTSRYCAPIRIHPSGNPTVGYETLVLLEPIKHFFYLQIRPIKHLFEPVRKYINFLLQGALKARPFCNHFLAICAGRTLKCRFCRFFVGLLVVTTSYIPLQIDLIFKTS